MGSTEFESLAEFAKAVRESVDKPESEWDPRLRERMSQLNTSDSPEDFRQRILDQVGIKGVVPIGNDGTCRVIYDEKAIGGDL